MDGKTVLLWMLDEAYETPAWHGPNLRESIRRVPVAEAVWRPGPAQRNIWEITVHAAYWKYVAWRRLRGEKRGSFPRKGSDWFVLPPPSDEGVSSKEAGAWRADQALLEEMHRRLREAVTEVADDQWETPTEGSRATRRALVSGVAAHDVYHAGQIQTLRHLHRAALGRGEA